MATSPRARTREAGGGSARPPTGPSQRGDRGEGALPRWSPPRPTGARRVRRSARADCERGCCLSAASFVSAAAVSAWRRRPMVVARVCARISCLSHPCVRCPRTSRHHPCPIPVSFLVVLCSIIKTTRVLSLLATWVVTPPTPRAPRHPRRGFWFSPSRLDGRQRLSCTPQEPALGIERTRFIIVFSLVRAPPNARSWCLGRPPSTCAHDYVLASFLASASKKTRKGRFCVKRVRTANS